MKNNNLSVQNGQMPDMPMMNGSSEKKFPLVLVVLAVVVLALGVAIYKFSILDSLFRDLEQPLVAVRPTPSVSVLPSNSPSETNLEEDTSAAINEELGAIEIDDVDSEFKDIDTDLNAL